VPAAAIDDVHEVDDDIREDTPEERWQNSLRNVAGNAIALSAYWTMSPFTGLLPREFD
jgi:hypothetical protein